MNKAQNCREYEPDTLSDPAYVVHFVDHAVCTQPIAGIGLVCQGGSADDEIILVPEDGSTPYELAVNVSNIFHTDEDSRVVYRSFEDNMLHWVTPDGKSRQAGYVLSECLRIYSCADADTTRLVREHRGDKKELYSWKGSGFFELKDNMITIITDEDAPIPLHTCMTPDGEILEDATRSMLDEAVFSELFFGLCDDRYRYNYGTPPEPWLSYLRGKAVTLRTINAMIDVFRESGAADESKIKPFSELLRLLSQSGYEADEDIALHMRRLICSCIEHGNSRKHIFSPAMVKKLQRQYKKAKVEDAPADFDSREFT